MEQPHIYRIELSSEEERWASFDVALMAEGFDASGESCHLSQAKRFREEGAAESKISLSCEPCSSLDLYIYVIPHTLPESSSTEDTPPVEAHLTLYDHDELFKRELLEINPWGGYTARLRLPKEEQ